MNRVRFALALIVLAVAVVALLSGITALADQKALGTAFTQYSGLLSLLMMTVALLLAARPVWIEPMLSGLDKMYRLHKWLGIGAVVAAIAHWQLRFGGDHGPRGAPATGADAAGQTAQGWLDSLRGPAHGIAQPAMFVLFAFVAVALIKRIPYKWFGKTHWLVVLPFAALVFHSVALIDTGYWSKPAGWATLAAAAVGLAAALYSLFGLIGRSRTVDATVTSSFYYPELRVLETNLRIDRGWGGHRPGQFAFITTDRSEGAHPFTIATAWDAATGAIGFIAKELGDHTRDVRQHFAPGKKARIQGPYGCFTFDDGKPVQIWVGAGIGITPFVARMRHLGVTPGGPKVHLFHSTTDVSETALGKMRADAAAADVQLHILVSPRDGRLTAADMQQEVPDWKSGSVWFCGPRGFGEALRKDFRAAGLAAKDFHQELFEMR